MMRRSLLVDERSIEVFGRSVRVRVHGKGPPVLLINGLGANVTTWNALLGELEGFEVITFDAPGTGLSQSPLVPYTIDRIAEVARQVLDHTGHQRADVLGYSLGGAVAQRLAFKEPERVRRLVLVSSSCGAGGIPGSVKALMAVTTPARHYSKAAYDLTYKLVDLAPAERESTAVRAQNANWHRDAPPSPLGYLLQMTAFWTFHSLPWLPRLTHPTLVLTGTEDRLMPMANSAVLAAYLPDARLSVYERWGHYLLHDPASGAGATIADFLGTEDHEASTSWKNARTVGPHDLAAFVKAAPRSAHPAHVTGGLVRRRHPLQNGTD